MSRLFRVPLVAGLVGLMAVSASAQTFVINGKRVTLATVSKGGKVFVDAAAFAKALGASVTYDKAKHQFIIATGGGTGGTTGGTTGGGGLGAQGTSQLAGEWGEFGKSYTIGKSSPMNFTLRSAEFTCGRLRFSDAVHYPKANEKLLVLHYTLQNPQSSERGVSWSTFDFTAVDATDTNREYLQEVGIESNQSRLDVYLKPAQKIEVYTAIRVPAKGEVPKLIVKTGDGLVARYDLRGKVKPLAAPFADPSDASGFSAYSEVPAQMGTYYPTGVFDIKLDGAAYTHDTLYEHEPSEGARFLLLNATIKNQAAGEKNVGWSTFTPKLRTQDGENVDWNQDLLHGTRNELLDANLDPGQEARARYFFDIRGDTAAKTLSIKEGDDDRVYSFDLSGVK
jgi:hypothetical protein